MEKISNYLENLSKMALYSELQFLFCGNVKNYKTPHGRYFESYGIQYNSGALEFGIDDDEMKLYNGSYAFISKPGYFYKYNTPRNKSRAHAYVTFVGDRVKDYIENDLLDTEKPELILIHNPVRFTDLMHLLHVEFIRDRNSPELISLLDRLLFVLKAEKAYQSTSLKIHEKILQECEEYIISRPDEKHDFRLWAKKAGVSYAHFRRLFQQYAGTPLQSFTLQCRFNTALKYLLESDKRISEIAELCGWEDVYFFSKQFKQKFDISPLGFRKKHKNN